MEEVGRVGEGRGVAWIDDGGGVWRSMSGEGDVGLIEMWIWLRWGMVRCRCGEPRLEDLRCKSYQSSCFRRV